MKNLFYLSLFAIFFSLLSPTLTLAASPTLITPPNGVTFSTLKPKLTWTKFSDCESNSCYKVEISPNDTFTPLEKTSYTNGVEDSQNPQLLSYNPSLSVGTWYWHVKGKNPDGSWGDFSETRLFTISTTAAPQPTPTNTKNVLGTSTEKQNFTISADSNQLKDLDPLTVSVTLSNLEPNTQFYLKGAFYKEGSSNYFGFTQLDNNWIKNASTYNTQYPITTDQSGSWQGNIIVRNDPTDSGYPGTGDYQLKVGRYTSDGSGPIWSNSLSIKLEAKKITATTTTTTSTVTPPPAPQETPTPAFNTDTNVLGENTTLNFSASPDTSGNNYKLPDITAKNGVEDGGIPPVDQKVLVAGQKTTNWWFISSGTILVAIGAFYYWRSKRKQTFAQS